MSEYGSNNIEMDYEEEQNEEENDEENYQRQEDNNYNNSQNYNNNINNVNDNNNLYNPNNNEKEEEEDQENNISNNISMNKYQNTNKENNYNINNNKNNSLSHDNNSFKKGNENDKEEVIEDNPESPEILYEEFFNYFLPNKKSTLTIKECKNAMRCLGLVVTEREIQEYLEIKEKTGKEKINLEEFKAICNKKFNETNSNNISELEEAFELLDPEHTGIVDSMVLRHQMKIFKPKITDEEVNQILSEFGEDKNGNINYREYIKNIKP